MSRRARASAKPRLVEAPSPRPRLVTAELHEPSGKVMFRLPTIGVSAAVDETEAEQVIAEAREALDEARQRRGGGVLTYERALAVLCGDDGEAVR